MLFSILQFDYKKQKNIAKQKNIIYNKEEKQEKKKRKTRKMIKELETVDTVRERERELHFIKRKCGFVQ